MDWHVYAVIGAFCCIDIVTGVAKGVVTTGFSSSKMRMGLMHKLTYVAAMALAYLVEYMAVYLDLGFSLSALSPAVAVYISVAEVGSILENITAINPSLSENGFLEIFSRNK